MGTRFSCVRVKADGFVLQVNVTMKRTQKKSCSRMFLMCPLHHSRYARILFLYYFTLTLLGRVWKQSSSSKMMFSTCIPASSHQLPCHSPVLSYAHKYIQCRTHRMIYNKYVAWKLGCLATIGLRENLKIFKKVHM